MKKKKVLFKIGYIYHKAAFDPVIDIMINNEKYDVWFEINPEKRKRFFIKYNYHSPIIKEWEREGYRFTEKRDGFDLIITGDTISNINDYGKTIICFLNHGTGLKNVFYRNLARVTDHLYHIFVEGDFRVNSLKDPAIIGKSKVYKVGLPKLDHYYQGKYDDKNDILRKLGLDTNKQTVLFAPTYKPTCLGMIKDDIFEQTTDYNLIIKLHPYSWMGKYAPHWHHRVYEKRIKKYRHAALLPFEEYNIVPYFAASDTLISEASATVFDYLAINKTGIIFDLPCDSLNHSDGMPILEIDNRTFLKDAFIHISSGKQIKDAIERALNPTESMIITANKYRDELFYGLDGQASQRFIEIIERLIAEGGHENIPK